MLERLVDRLVSATLAISGVLLVSIAVFILVEILLRTALNISMNVVVEFVGYAMAPMVTFAMAGTMRSGQLVRVNLLLVHLPMSAHRWIEAGCVVISFVVTLWLGYLFWGDVAINWQRGAISATIAGVPLWIAPAAALAGITVFLIALAAYLVRLLHGGELIRDPEATVPQLP